MSQLGLSARDKQVSSDAARNASILFAQATGIYRGGQLCRAMEIFDEVVALCQKEDTLKDGLTCVSAHISLYRIHRALGNDREAAEHFSKAVSLGASAERLKQY